MKSGLFYAVLAVFFCAFLFLPSQARAASFSLSPSSGSFEVGSTFDVSVLVNTEGQTINALEAVLAFPADKIQLVSPSTGQSVVSLWVSPPQFDNRTGRIELRGGIPGGLNAQRGQVITFTFRVNQIGSGTIRFLDDSQIYLHDGQGTEVLHQTQNGVYRFVLPPPAGPIVASPTHPEQTRWYSDSNLVLTWPQNAATEGYSYELNREPATIPDNISEDAENSVSYTKLGDGIHYFHIKELQNGRWGGTTHYAVHVDTTPPSEFPIRIRPSERTSNRQPVIEFFTTDQASGLQYYELKIVQLSATEDSLDFEETNERFFIEATSPYAPPELPLGTYDVLIRAYDYAGNYQETVQEMNIVSPILQIEKEGIQIGGALRISWPIILGILSMILILVAVIAWRIRKWRVSVETQQSKRELPGAIKEQLGELRKYRTKYGKLIIAFAFGTAFLFANTPLVLAQEQLNPPLISTTSRDISNEEIFYAGGKADITDSEIVLYIQNLRTGETTTRIAPVDKKGDWFYRHDSFLSSGEYLLWGQARLGEQTSPPTPQIQFSVQPTAIQFGSSRISSESLYLAITIALLALLAILITYIIRHTMQARKKYEEFMKEVQEAQEAVRRGFAVLRHDVETELHSLSAKKSGRRLSEKDLARERELLEDLAEIEQRIGKEILDIERLEYRE